MRELWPWWPRYTEASQAVGKGEAYERSHPGRRKHEDMFKDNVSGAGVSPTPQKKSSTKVPENNPTTTIRKESRQDGKEEEVRSLQCYWARGQTE
jgi:hypothetical protein